MPNAATLEDAITLLYMSLQEGVPLAHLVIQFGFTYPTIQGLLHRARKAGANLPFLRPAGGPRRPANPRGAAGRRLRGRARRG